MSSLARHCASHQSHAKCYVFSNTRKSSADAQPLHKLTVRRIPNIANQRAEKADPYDTNETPDCYLVPQKQLASTAICAYGVVPDNACAHLCQLEYIYIERM